LVATPIGIFATRKRGGFVLQRATKPAKELIAQNPPQVDLDLGLGFRKASSSSRCSRQRQQVAASRQQEQGSSVHLSLLWYSVARRKQQENCPRLQQVKSVTASPLSFSLIASQPRSFSYLPRMARNAKCAFVVAMALGRARQAAEETLTGKSGLPELAPLLSA